MVLWKFLRFFSASSGGFCRISTKKLWFHWNVTCAQSSHYSNPIEHVPNRLSRPRAQIDNECSTNRRTNKKRPCASVFALQSTTIQLPRSLFALNRPLVDGSSDPFIWPRPLASFWIRLLLGHFPEASAWSSVFLLEHFEFVWENIEAQERRASSDSIHQLDGLCLWRCVSASSVDECHWISMKRFYYSFLCSENWPIGADYRSESMKNRSKTGRWENR